MIGPESFQAPIQPTGITQTITLSIFRPLVDYYHLFQFFQDSTHFGRIGAKIEVDKLTQIASAMPGNGIAVMKIVPTTSA